MGKNGRLTRAQIIAGFWALFGFYMAGRGVKQVLADSLGVTSGGYIALGLFGFGLGVLHALHPEHVANGEERVDWRVEAAVVFALVFVGAASAYVLFA